MRGKSARKQKDKDLGTTVPTYNLCQHGVIEYGRVRPVLAPMLLGNHEHSVKKEKRWEKGGGGC